MNNRWCADSGLRFDARNLKRGIESGRVIAANELRYLRWPTLPLHRQIFETERRTLALRILKKAYDPQRRSVVIKTLNLFLRQPKTGMDKIVLLPVGWYPEELIREHAEEFLQRLDSDP